MEAKQVTEDLSDAWARPFEALPPVRDVVQYKGQRNFTGAWWCATTRSHVGFESWLERDHVMLLDYARAVVRIASQPFCVAVETDNGPRRHAPDYFVRNADGSATVVDIRPDELVGDDAFVFRATAQACSLVGWSYRRLGRPAPVLAENLRWLAGYRHTRCARSDLLPRVSEMTRLPVPLGR
ncbi:TnsA-like heteromeric transposase endonuclease subunit [Promicromonospora sp. NPDC023987]|uniref:TnsA-like heteromeric transposase endonuclease subunit n=1 Tax=Promicromonospora sp. NPDC023987 TaxID=3155360 RepID=UPI0033DD1AF0